MPDPRKQCTIDGCKKEVVARGWCGTHYSRWQRHGDPSPQAPIQKPGPGECQHENCGLPSVGRGLCRKHYGRWRRHGDPSVVLPKVGAPRQHAICSVGGCGRPHLANSYCAMHNRRWVKSGRTDPLFVSPKPDGSSHGMWSGDEGSYAAAHRRVYKAHGKASKQLCVDCGAQAAEWSYIGGDPHERIGEVGGKQLAYSLDERRYAPRCHSCHITFDKRR